MKSRTGAIDWILAASAVILFIFGRLIAPRYEELMRLSGGSEPGWPVSLSCLFASGLLVACLLTRWGLRFRSWLARRKKGAKIDL